MGRPCKLTPEVQGRLVEALAMGGTRRLACEYAGIGESTLSAWCLRDDSVYVELQAALKAAESRACVGALAKIQAAANNGVWQAAAWLLERRHPEEYGRRQVVALARAPIEPVVEDLAAAAKRGVGAVDASVLWQRQVSAVEAGYARGELTLEVYLERMDRLSAQATRLAELAARAPSAEGAPHVQLALTIDSPGVRDPAPLPEGVVRGARAAAGGDLIDVG